MDCSVDWVGWLVGRGEESVRDEEEREGREEDGPPPPPRREELAALTIQSTSSLVISPRLRASAVGCEQATNARQGNEKAAERTTR